MCKQEVKRPEFSTRIYAYKNLWFVIGKLRQAQP
jgi:hypothetical protein